MAHMKMALNEKTLQSKPASMADVEVRSGLEFQRKFTNGKVSPYDAVEWERRVAQIGNEKGMTIFRQENVDVPKGWSQTATNIVASKYFHGKLNTPDREGSVRQLIGRVETCPDDQHLLGQYPAFQPGARPADSTMVNGRGGDNRAH